MKNMVDVSSGKMNLREVMREFDFYMRQCILKSPMRVRMIVDVRRKENGYHATIWIPKRCFGDDKES